MALLKDAPLTSNSGDHSPAPSDHEENITDPATAGLLFFSFLGLVDDPDRARAELEEKFKGEEAKDINEVGYLVGGMLSYLADDRPVLVINTVRNFNDSAQSVLRSRDPEMSHRGEFLEGFAKTVVTTFVGELEPAEVTAEYPDILGPGPSEAEMWADVRGESPCEPFAYGSSLGGLIGRYIRDPDAYYRGGSMNELLIILQELVEEDVYDDLNGLSQYEEYLLGLAQGVSDGILARSEK